MSEQTVVGRQGLVVGLPFCGRPVAPEWAIALQSLNYPANMNLSISALKGVEVGEARCRIVQHALSIGAKYVFFLDDDVAPPYYAVRRLIYALEQADDNVMVAAGIYVNKQPVAPEPMVFQEDGDGPFWKWKVGEVFECGSVGTGCMVIKTEVFQHLAEPWFKTVNECDEESDIRKLEMTDDLYFCKKVRDAGFKLIADGGVLCIHWDVFACKCTHPAQQHDKSKGLQPCGADECDCKAYVMGGRAYVLPPDSFPLRAQVMTAGETGD